MNSTGTIHIVFGPQGAGKSTIARRLAQEVQGIRFAIDDWMHQLYGPDLPKPMNLAWIMERVQRCEKRIWQTASDAALIGTNIILDLGFMKKESRRAFRSLAENENLEVKFHFVDAPYEVRKERVLARNNAKGETFTFEVTAEMFDFMDNEFQVPEADELIMAVKYNTY